MATHKGDFLPTLFYYTKGANLIVSLVGIFVNSWWDTTLGIRVSIGILFAQSFLSTLIYTSDMSSMANKSSKYHNGITTDVASVSNAATVAASSATMAANAATTAANSSIAAANAATSTSTTAANNAITAANAATVATTSQMDKIILGFKTEREDEKRVREEEIGLLVTSLRAGKK